MDIQWLREFIHLSETQNYRATADALFISHSTLSKHISSMEQEFSAQLLIRDTRSVRLTSQGEKLFKVAKTIISQYDMCLDSLSSTNVVEGKLQIGCCIRVPEINYLVSSALRVFEKKYPDVDIRVQDIYFHDYDTLLEKSALDFVFSLHFLHESENFRYCDLVDTCFEVWVGKDNRYCDFDSLPLKQLADMRLRVSNQGKSLNYMHYLRSMFAKYGLTPQFGKSLTYGYAFGENEYALVPIFDSKDAWGADIQHIPLTQPENISFCMAHRKHLTNPVAQMFHDEFMRVNKEMFVERESMGC